jgi:hypothetical protein
MPPEMYVLMEDIRTQSNKDFMKVHFEGSSAYATITSDKVICVLTAKSLLQRITMSSLLFISILFSGVVTISGDRSEG